MAPAAVRVALVLFDGVDLLDVGGPYEVFLTANRLSVREGKEPPFEVVTVSVGGVERVAYGGLRLIPEASLEGLECDVLIVPGLIDVTAAMEDRSLLDAIRNATKSPDIVASVCTGALLLASTGLLDGTMATTHFEDVAALGDLIGTENAVHERWVDSGRVVTAGGLSSGMAMALHLVSRLESPDLAERTARQLEYQWDPGAGMVVSG